MKVNEAIKITDSFTRTKKMPGLSYSLPAWACKTGQKLAKIPESEKIGLRIFPKKKSMLDYILELVGMQTKTAGVVDRIEAKLRQYNQFFPALMMPYTIHIY